jgi:hypothetical protein
MSVRSALTVNTLIRWKRSFTTQTTTRSSLAPPLLARVDATWATFAHTFTRPTRTAFRKSRMVADTVHATPNRHTMVLGAREGWQHYQPDHRFYTRVLLLCRALSNTLLYLDYRTSFADTALSFALISALLVAPAAHVATATLVTTLGSMIRRPIDPTQLSACHSLSEPERAGRAIDFIHPCLFILHNIISRSRAFTRLLHNTTTQYRTERNHGYGCNHVD